MKKLKITDKDVRHCALLSREDIASAPKETLYSNCWWWLQSQGFCKYYALGVNKDGEIDDHDGYIYGVAVIKPALFLKEKICSTGERYLLCRKVFMAVADDVIVYCGSDMRAAYAKKEEAYNDYNSSNAKAFVESWYASFCEEMERCNNISQKRAVILLKRCVDAIIAAFSEDKDKADALLNIGITADELTFLGYDELAVFLEDAEKEFLEHVDDKIDIDILSLMPTTLTSYSDWVKAVKKWAVDNNKEYTREEIEEIAAGLTLKNNPAFTFRKNIELADVNTSVG